jgi:hypothetical protein
MATHTQTWVKVNVPVDTGVAEIVSILNRVDGLETLQSCQGDAGREDGYVYFARGNWNTICQFVFETIGPKLKERLDEDANIRIDAVASDMPVAKLSFKAEAANMVASALKEIIR